MIHFLSKSLILALIASVVLSATSASAVEVRIVDQQGLLRAVRSVKSKAKLNINIKLDKNITDYPDSITLVSVDGIAGDLEAAHSVEGNYILDVTAGGTWKIITTGRGIVVTSVKLEEVY